MRIQGKERLGYRERGSQNNENEIPFSRTLEQEHTATPSLRCIKRKTFHLHRLQTSSTSHILNQTLQINHLPYPITSPLEHYAARKKIMNSTTPLLSKTWPLTTPIRSLSALLDPHVLFEVVSSICVWSIELILIICGFLVLMSSLEHLVCVLGVTDKDNQAVTMGFLNFILDPYILAAICIGPDFSLGFEILEIDGFGLDSLCSVGLLLAVVVPKGLIEGRIVYTVLSQGVKLVQRWKKYRRGRNVKETTDEQTEMDAEKKGLADV
jgi:hypothetical protein